MYLAGWDSEENDVSILSHIFAILYGITEAPCHRDGTVLLQSHGALSPRGSSAALTSVFTGSEGVRSNKEEKE